MAIEKTMGDKGYIHHDPEIGDRFEGFAGGLAWPGAKAGFLCVLGAKFPTDPDTGRWSLRVVHEEYQTRMDELARRCAILAGEYNQEDWLVDREGDKAAYVRMFYDRVEETRPRGESRNVYIYQPSLSQDIGLALQVLRRRFSDNTLTVPPAGILIRQLEAIHREEDTGQAGLLDRYPEVMVLASLVHFLDQSPYGHEDDEPESDEDDYGSGRDSINGY